MAKWQRLIDQLMLYRSNAEINLAKKIYLVVFSKFLYSIEEILPAYDIQFLFFIESFSLKTSENPASTVTLFQPISNTNQLISKFLKMSVCTAVLLHTNWEKMKHNCRNIWNKLRLRVYSWPWRRQLRKQSHHKVDLVVVLGLSIT